MLRRLRAVRRRSAYSDVWPIDEKAGGTPPGWPGWPGKRFAFVLTHDVEGTRGLDRVESLMKLESELGFRSSFNFVPEGEYRLSAELRQTVADAGFEIGIHGLEHDGKLYNSKARFAGKAVRIREYLREWKSIGFRSPLMQHKLEWLHLLGVEYDESTFDTDPFEPQPDAAGTIFHSGFQVRTDPVLSSFHIASPGFHALRRSESRTSTFGSESWIGWLRAAVWPS